MFRLDHYRRRSRTSCTGHSRDWPSQPLHRRGRAMGHVRVTCNSCHDQLQQTVFYEPPHDSGHRPLTGWVTGPDPQP